MIRQGIGQSRRVQLPTRGVAVEKDAVRFRVQFRYLILLCAAILLCGGIKTPAAATEPSGSSLAALSLFPAADAIHVCPDTPLRIDFAEPPTLSGLGKIQVFDAAANKLVETIDTGSRVGTRTIGGLGNFHYYPVIITGNEAAIYLQNTLSYNKSYYITIEPGVFKNDAGSFGGMSATTDWRFTTKPAPPAIGNSRLVVAADGSGDFCTVQGALDFIPAGNNKPTTLFIRKGIYTELIYFADKNSLTFLGEDRKQTIIQYANNDRFNHNNDRHIYHRGVLLADRCNDLVITNLTMRNNTPRGGTQSETIILKGTTQSQAIISHVDLYSFQDTLQANGQAYVSDCYIEGDVDFIWGIGPCYFENCHCYGTRDHGYYTQIRNTNLNHGYVFHHCLFDGPPAITNMYLTRIAPALYPNSEVVFLDCAMGKSCNAVGWLLNSIHHPTTQPSTTQPSPTPLATTQVAVVPTTQPDPPAPYVHFWEFNSHDLAGNPIDITHRLPASRQLTLATDAKLITEYSDPTFVLGNHWVPHPPPPVPQQP
jgi:pectin methylesterase-like acyl-CoA thioesterase